jgi:nitrite reductase/ring-hydroxylating ferredoxin subunit
MNAYGGWVRVASEQDLLEQGRMAISVDGTAILLVQLDGQVYAIGNRCPHLECTMTRGKLSGYVILCPCHDWAFDIRSGELVIAKEITIPVYQVKTDTQQIYIKINQSGVINA